ncbi:metabolite traffic protein EboE [Pontibacter sp. KCTC 32443]|uniref:metabolite traffic protein EboE n=1 Tax=Pontibacter TaxID=323449 RepID=UPI00164ED96A|nr:MULTISPECIES: metabolite traffic protein EboE [Pontibacter]MBC5772996.1 metabolite traffic protein EboE [Pontibacter sp. KCTC 32443]
MNLPNGTHLTYCTNIHPGESWAEVLINLKNYLPDLKKRLSPDAPFGVGLRLSNLASQELLIGNNLQEFKNWLDTEDLYVFTMNGFPYGGFHHKEVKDAVHKPDWTTQNRLAYTIRLAYILAELLPEGIEGGISTSPLSYKPWLGFNKDRFKEVFELSALHLTMVTEELLFLKETKGRTIHIDIEPEPDGLLENTQEVIHFYQKWLLYIGCKRLACTKGMLPDAAVSALLDHIRICYDVCHFALAYEVPAEAFAKLNAAGIQIGKIQLSSALKTELPSGKAEREELAARLRPFAESTYLHQVVEREINGKLNYYSDLPYALQNIQKPTAAEWRTHYHVPLFTNGYIGLQSTQEDVETVLNYVQDHDLTNHLEVETYTWEVLPEGLKTDLASSIARELEWVMQHIQVKENA